MNNHGAVLKLQIFTVVLTVTSLEILAATTVANHRPLSPSTLSTDPHYRFHYLGKNEKADEKLSIGDNATSSFRTVEAKSDQLVTNHTADDSAGFANINIPAAPAPNRGAPFIGSTIMPPFVGQYNNFYRNGISPPLKNHKPLREINPIVVKSLTIPPPIALAPALMPARIGNLAPEFPQPPYAFYRESRNDSSTVQGADILNSIRQLVHTNTTSMNVTSAAEKSEASFLENFEIKTVSPVAAPAAPPALPATVTPTPINSENKSFGPQSLPYLERGGFKSATNTRPTVENVMSNRNLVHLPPSNGVNQLQKMDIPSSIMEILNQNKAQGYSADSGNVYALPPPNTFTDMNILRPSSGTLDNLTRMVENKANNSSSGQKERANTFVPQRPMRLIGLNPMFVDNIQLQSITENLTVPQFHWEPLTSIQYVAPIPLHPGTLPYGPFGPFQNVPRSVNEPPNPDMPLVNQIPLMNSFAIPTPIMPQPVPAPDGKSDAKADSKALPSPFMLCNDCMMPSNYVSYPFVRIQAPPASAPVPSPGASPLLNSLNSIPVPSPNVAAIPQPNANGNGLKAPCTNNAAGPAPSWASYAPSLPAAYILVPTPLLKNKVNDTRTISAKIFT